ncbi:ABC transporter permease [Lacticaseibacillus sp. N501-2]|uniref:ABC transporter permease n=1 Tax=Lacticaseibacillus salsurae TaxID=3367729 RepID=UPI0038B28C5E
MKHLWQTRLKQHSQAQFKYLKLVFNDHFVLVLIIMLGALLYGYSQLVKTMTASWWLPGALALGFTALLGIGRLASLVQKADATFLLPKTTEFPQYLAKARRYSLALPLVVLTFATIAVIPMLKVLGLAVWDALALGAALWAFKDADLWLQVLTFYQGAPTWAKRRHLFGVVLVALGLGFYVHPAIALIAALVVALGLRWQLGVWLDPAHLDWLNLVQAEAKRMGQIYRFYNLFTDVPGLQGTVKRRKYLDGIAKTVFKKQKNTWAWLLIRSFLRRTEFLGLYLRLVVIGALCLAFVSQWWLALALSALFVYLIGFQLLPMYQVHDDIVFSYLYPLPQTQKPNAFKALVVKLLLMAAVINALGALAGGHWLTALAAIVGGLVVAVGFAGWYLPLRLRQFAKARS